MKTEDVFSFEVEDAIRRYSDMVYRIAVLNTKDLGEADDVFQDVFLKLLRYSKSIKSEEHLKAWLIRVTINESKDSVMSIWNKRKVSIDLLAEVADDTEEKDFSDVYMAVRNLDVKYRDVIHLFYYEQLSIKEISEVLERKEATIKTQLARGRKMLNKELKGICDYNAKI